MRISSSASTSTLNPLPHHVHAFVIATSSGLAREVHVWMYNTHVTCQGIVPAECLLLRAQVTPDLLLATTVNRVFVSREVVTAAEDRAARLAGRRIYSLAFVWTGLIVAGDIVCSCLLIVESGGRGGCGRCGGCIRRGAVCFATVFLKLSCGVEASVAVGSRASI